MDISSVSALPPDLFQVTPEWLGAYTAAHAGVLVIGGARNSAASDALESRKRELEQQLRSRHAGKDRAALRADPILNAYDEYYRRFGKTYHVQLQLESIVLKGKPIASGGALVEAMFMAEVDTGLLTAGHDLEAIHGTLQLGVAAGSESYTLLRGTVQTPKAGDMMIRDGMGVVSSVLYGPDERTRLRETTTRAIFTTYAPSGIAVSDLRRHMKVLLEYARVGSPEAIAEVMTILPEDAGK